MSLIRHTDFLKSVAKYAFTAFGGPQGHMGMMVKLFVEKRKDVSSQELLDYFSFCQMLPGPSSTQTITLIGYKRGGILLALLTLLIWILPAIVLMSGLSFIVKYVDLKDIQTNAFKYVQPMALGFLSFAAYSMMRISIKHIATACIMLMAIVFTLLFRSGWVFPILIIAGGFVSNFSDKRIPELATKRKPIKWINMVWFFLVFVIAGILSELARVNHWQFARGFNLFENFYRFGSIVFGGGHALLPLMFQQFIIRPEHLEQVPYLTRSEFLTGAGMVHAIPGPVFSICSYVGGMSLSNYGWYSQLAGCIIASVGVFLPSTLLILFFFPIYQNLKQYTVIFRSLEGIHAVIVGIMIASAIILFNNIDFQWTNVVVMLITLSILIFTKIPSPFIVLGWLFLGLAL
jgi:chromate transporter